MSGFTLEQIKKMRQDLEKRISIDIATFENDTGLQVDRIGVNHLRTVGETQRPVITLEILMPR